MFISWSVRIVLLLSSAWAVLAYLPETQLVKQLLKEYLPTSRPVLRVSDSVDVHLSLEIMSIVDLNLKDEFIALRGQLNMHWKDPALVWNQTEHGRLEQIMLRPDQIWTPDVILRNGLYDEAHSLPKPYVIVYNDGYVSYAPPIYYRAECNMNIQYYPFDRQECELYFNTWTYSLLEVNLTYDSSTGGLDLAHYDASSAFHLISGSANALERFYMCCPEPYQELYITLVLGRKTLYYMYTIIWPSVAISLVSLLVFRLSPESGEKISLGITVLLVFQVLVWSVGEELPKNGDQMPILALYITIIMLMTALSVGMSVIVLNTHEKKAKMPKCVHFLFMDILAKVLCFKIKSKHKKLNKDKQEQMNLLIDDLINDIVQSESTELSKQEVSVPMLGRKSRSKEDIQQEILRVLQIQMLKDAILDDDEGNEWKIVAQVIDRLLFWFFLIIVGGMALGMLVLVPKIY